MKRILCIAALCASTSVFSQLYVSAGLSTAVGEGYAASTYPSIEVGKSWDNLSAGLCVGSSNLLFDDGYWWETKGAVSVPLGSASGYFLAGGGSFFDSSHVLIEYGCGVTKKFGDGPASWFLQATSWDGTPYVGIGTTITLN